MSFFRKLCVVGSLLFIARCPLPASAAARHLESRLSKPNVVFILADDLGYGDVKAFGGKRSQTHTPNFDRLAAEGMRFTDAHAIAAVCVPSRIGLMTGRYAWRFRGPRFRAPWGFIGPVLPDGQFTLGTMLRAQGYRTGYVGKWHLGTVMQTKDGKTQGPTNVDYTAPLKIGPPQYGFDESFILPGSLDMYPYVFAPQQQMAGQGDSQEGLERLQPRRPRGRGLRGHEGARHFQPGRGNVHRETRGRGESGQTVLPVPGSHGTAHAGQSQCPIQRQKPTRHLRGLRHRNRPLRRADDAGPQKARARRQHVDHRHVGSRCSVLCRAQAQSPRSHS